MYVQRSRNVLLFSGHNASLFLYRTSGTFRLDVVETDRLASGGAAKYLLQGYYQ